MVQGPATAGTVIFPMPMTPALQNVAESASTLHCREKTSQITWRQLLLALLESRKCAAASMLQTGGLQSADLRRELLASVCEEPKGQAGTDSAWTAPAEDAFSLANSSAVRYQRNSTGTGDLLLAIRQTCPAGLVDLLDRYGWTETKFQGAPEVDAAGGLPVAPFVAVTVGALVFAAGRILSCGDPINGALAIGAAAATGWASRGKVERQSPADRTTGSPCHKCGYHSEIAQHFYPGAEGSLCLVCAEREPARVTQTWTVYSLILLVIGLGLVATLGYGWALVNLALVLLLPTLLVPLHELGHVLAAKLLGIEVSGVIVGSGPLLATSRFLGTTWSWHKHVTHGLVLLLPTGDFRIRYFLAVLGGPAMNLALALAPFLLSSRSLFPEYGLETALELPEVWVLSNLWLTAISLVPQQSSFGPSDGRQMLDILRGKWFSGEALPVLVISGVISHLIPAGRLIEAQALTERSLLAYPESLTLLLQRCLLHCQLENHSEARADALEVLSRKDAGPLYHAHALNAAAWSDLSLGPEHLEEALDFSRRALEAEPDSPHHLGTRGTVLLRAGRCEEARDYLARSIREHRTASSVAINYSHLVLAELGCGRVSEARQALVAARHFDSRCKELKEAEAAVQQVADSASR